jgi:hypothetical protein
MDPTQQAQPGMDASQNPGTLGIPSVMTGQSPLASAFSLMLSKLFDQLMQQWLAGQQARAQQAMGGAGGAGLNLMPAQGAPPPVMPGGGAPPQIFGQ